MFIINNKNNNKGKNMNNLKKIGLTALAASLVTTSAFAGEMSVAGSASIGVKNTTGTNYKLLEKALQWATNLLSQVVEN